MLCTIDFSDIAYVHKYLMKKHNIKYLVNV